MGDRRARWCGSCGDRLPDVPAVWRGRARTRRSPRREGRVGTRHLVGATLAVGTLALLSAIGASSWPPPATSASSGTALSVELPGDGEVPPPGSGGDGTRSEDPEGGTAGRASEGSLRDRGEADNRVGSMATGPLAPDGEGSPDDRPSCLTPDCFAWEQGSRATVAFPKVVQQDGLVVAFRLERRAVGREDPGTTDWRSVGAIEAIDAVTGQERWRVEVAGERPARPSLEVVVADDQILVLDAFGVLRSIALADGDVRWERRIEEVDEISQARLIGRDLVVVVVTAAGAGTRTERVLALDPATGSTRWTSEPTQRAVLTGPGPVLLDAFEAMRLLDTADGSERWRQPMEYLPTEVVGLETLFVAFDNRETRVVDARDGTLLHTLPSTFGGGTVGPRTRDDEGMVILGDGVLSHLGVDGASWTVKIEDCCRGSAFADDGRVVSVLLDDGRLRRLAREDGRSLGESTYAAPGGYIQPLLLAGGYVISDDGDWDDFDVIVRDARDGSPLARLGDAFPVGLTDEGALLLDRRGRLLALRPPADLRP